MTVEIVGDNLQRLIGSVPGPKDTPYDGGLFKVRLCAFDTGSLWHCVVFVAPGCCRRAPKLEDCL